MRTGLLRRLLPDFLARRGRVRVAFARDYSFTLPVTPLDPLRGEKILTYLVAEGLTGGKRVLEPEPAAMADLLRAHDGDYLDRLEEPGVATRITGIDLTPHQRQRAIAAQRSMTGGTLLAVRTTLRKGLTVNLGGGFHHAHRGEGRGFCILNDVAVAVMRLREDGFDEPILVVDLDLHDGDGTRAIFAEDPSVFTYSVHNRHWDDTRAVASESIALGSGVEDDDYLDTVRRTLPGIVRAHEPGLVVYLAGTDPAREDPLGDWKVSEEALLERDRLVLDLCDRADAPVAICLAGGYGESTWRPTARLLAWIACGEEREMPTTEEVLLDRYRALAKITSARELTGRGDDDDWELTEADIVGALGQSSDERFLGYYTRHGLELALERNGIYDLLRDRGFENPNLEMSPSSGTGDTLRIWSDPEREELLVEIRLARDQHTVPGFDMLRVEWLLLQNPRADFPPEQTPLPGQSHPGLGLLKDTVAMFVVACQRLGLDGILFVPSHYHLATHSDRYLRFLRPEDAGRFRALREALEDLPLAEATRAVDEGRVRIVPSGEAFRWEPTPMVLPVSEELAARFDEGYEVVAGKAEEDWSFRVDPGSPIDARSEA